MHIQLFETIGPFETAKWFLFVTVHYQILKWEMNFLYQTDKKEILIWVELKSFVNVIYKKDKQKKRKSVDAIDYNW